MREFFREWFGAHAGREIFKDHTREFMETPEELSWYVQYCIETKQPAWMSVQPFRARNEVFAIDRLFWDFDCKEDLNKAWDDAVFFAVKLEEYYGAYPLLVFSGCKGFHVYAFLNSTLQFWPTWREGLIKQAYEMLQHKILEGFSFGTLDPAPLGDIRRLCRVPYSVHEKTGKLCEPVDRSRSPLRVDSLETYQKEGLDSSMLVECLKEAKAKEKWNKIRARNARIFVHTVNQSEVRPCIKTGLSLPLHHGHGHKMRLAIAAEFLNMGYDVGQVVSLFQNQTDFGNGEKSRYFVEDARRKQYKPFKCKTIRELGYCLGQDCPIYRKRGR